MRKFSLIALVATLSLCQDASDPWTKSEVLEPAALASLMKDSKSPTVLCVAFPVLYHLKHISHSSFAGPGSKPEGIEMLKKAVASLPKDTDLRLLPDGEVSKRPSSISCVEGAGFHTHSSVEHPDQYEC